MLIINILVIVILIPAAIFSWTMLIGLIRWHLAEKKELKELSIENEK